MDLHMGLSVGLHGRSKVQDLFAGLVTLFLGFGAVIGSSEVGAIEIVLAAASASGSAAPDPVWSAPSSLGTRASARLVSDCICRAF